jgi:hypothetical protein
MTIAHYPDWRLALARMRSDAEIVDELLGMDFSGPETRWRVALADLIDKARAGRARGTEPAEPVADFDSSPGTEIETDDIVPATGSEEEE